MKLSLKLIEDGDEKLKGTGHQHGINNIIPPSPRQATWRIMLKKLENSNALLSRWQNAPAPTVQAFVDSGGYPKHPLVHGPDFSDV